jgi:hypothetical protein
MRAPDRPFRNEIAAYRKKWTADRQGKEIPEVGRKLLARWETDKRADEIWSTLTGKLPPEAMPTAEELIYLVVARRLLADEIKRETTERPGVINEADKRTKQQLQGGAYSQLILENEARREYEGRRGGLISRKAKTAPRKFFVEGWSQKFMELCGQPLDEEVAVLTYFAFGVEMSADQVRYLRKPTTGRDRDIRQRSMSR